MGRKLKALSRSLSARFAALCVLACLSAAAVLIARAETEADAIDQSLIEAFEDFFGVEQNEDGGLSPDWWLEAYYLGGEWRTDPPPLAFHVAESQPAASGSLSIEIDAAVLGQENLVLALTYEDTAEASLYIGLSYWPESSQTNENPTGIFLGDLYGNIIQDQEEIVTEYFEIPLSSLDPQYRKNLSVDIYRGSGEITVVGAALCTETEFYDWLNQDLAEGSDETGTEDEPIQDSESPDTADPSDRAEPESGPDADSTANVSNPDQEAASEIITLTLQSQDFVISRCVLDSGGTRQTSASFILEDSIGQSSAIGFSSDSDLVLHGGFQQVDLIEILNVSVTPPAYDAEGNRRFNPGKTETATLSYVLSERAETVTIKVWSENNTNAAIVTNILSGLDAGLHTLQWDGRDSSGAVVLVDVYYRFSISAASYDGQVFIYEPEGAQTNQVRIEVVDNTKVITSVSDTPDPFKPLEGETSAISHRVSNGNPTVAIEIRDAGGSTVTTLYPTPKEADVEWDGIDSATNAMRDGLYSYGVKAEKVNEKTGAIVLVRENTNEAISADSNAHVRYSGASVVDITEARSDQLTNASFAIFTAEPKLFLQSLIYEITATPSTNFAPPAILTFKYDPAIVGDIEDKLKICRYDPSAPLTSQWVAVTNQFIDYANNRILAEITNLSLYAVFVVEELAAPVVPEAVVRLEPESLNVNPGILTAFVSLPEGYPESGIISATCDGASCESMMLNADGTEMVIKFRRQDIEAALAEIGETIDTSFLLNITWQSDAETLGFEGSDTITKIVD